MFFTRTKMEQNFIFVLFSTGFSKKTVCWSSSCSSCCWGCWCCCRWISGEGHLAMCGFVHVIFSWCLVLWLSTGSGNKRTGSRFGVCLWGRQERGVCSVGQNKTTPVPTFQQREYRSRTIQKISKILLQNLRANSLSQNFQLLSRSRTLSGMQEPRRRVMPVVVRWRLSNFLEFYRDGVVALGGV